MLLCETQLSTWFGDEAAHTTMWPMEAVTMGSDDWDTNETEESRRKTYLD